MAVSFISTKGFVKWIKLIERFQRTRNKWTVQKPYTHIVSRLRIRNNFDRVENGHAKGTCLQKTTNVQEKLNNVRRLFKNRNKPVINNATRCLRQWNRATERVYIRAIHGNLTFL